MTATDDVRYILQLLGPLEQTSRYCIGIRDGRLAVIMLEEPANVARDEWQLALRLHAALGSRLLIVL